MRARGNRCLAGKVLPGDPINISAADMRPPDEKTACCLSLRALWHFVSEKYAAPRRGELCCARSKKLGCKHKNIKQRAFDSMGTVFALGNGARRSLRYSARSAFLKQLFPLSFKDILFFSFNLSFCSVRKFLPGMLEIIKTYYSLLCTSLSIRKFKGNGDEKTFVYDLQKILFVKKC